MLTFKNIQDKVLLYMDQAGETGTGLDLVKQAIQSAHEKRLSNERWSFMLYPTPQAFTLVANQRNYILVDGVQSLSDFWNLTNGEPMHEVATRARFKPGVQESIFRFEFVNDSPVAAQPPVPQVVTVTGHCILRYLSVEGTVLTEDLSNAPTALGVDQILNVTQMPDVNGDLQELHISGTIPLLDLGAGDPGHLFKQIRLFGDPTSADSMTYRFYRLPMVLTNDYDIPEIPFPYSNVLIYDALLELATYNDAQAPGFWVAQASDWDQKIKQAYQEGEAEGSESRQVIEADTYGG